MPFWALAELAVLLLLSHSKGSLGQAAPIVSLQIHRWGSERFAQVDGAERAHAAPPPADLGAFAARVAAVGPSPHRQREHKRRLQQNASCSMHIGPSLTVQAC